ncbi:MAG: hypothetical protein ACRD3Q_21280 [Terriglobales bacterium]
MKKKTTKAKADSEPAVKRTLRSAATPSEAQRLAATILEVLAGLRSPTAASQALAISLPRYYQLESRALEGLVAALAPRPQGKQPSLENRVKLLEKQLAAAHRQCARQEALVRVTQRTLGLSLAIPAKSTLAERGADGRKKRRPVVRALKAARTLHTQAAAHDAAAGAGQVDLASLQPTAPDCGAEEVRACPV